MKKIMFDDKYGLTKAVLEGRKTMTRRIAEKVLVEDIDQHLVWTGEFKKPKYKVGEIVAVAQCYEEALSPLDWVNRLIYKDELGWKNKMYVQADLMPHQIRITNVRVQRLQDISDEDCVREGIQWANGGFYSYYNHLTGARLWLSGKSAKKAFAELINRISGKGIFESNPWVFVYEFELVK